MSDVPIELRQAAERFARPDALDRIPGARTPRGSRAAAVLILLSQGESGYEVVLVEKRPDLRHHAGQVAFPGGRIESSDADPVAAALREGHEEVGIDPDSVEVLGVLPTAHIVRSGFDVTSAVGWWRRPRRLAPVDVGEIAAVHHVQVATLLAPENRLTWVHHSGLTGPTFLVDDLFVWGLTAYLLDGLFELLEWTLPWDQTRRSEIPRRFLSDRL